MAPISLRNAYALDLEHEEELTAIRAQALRSHAMRSPALSMVALVECLSDVSIRYNLQHKGA
jgi:hypothetical protein